MQSNSKPKSVQEFKNKYKENDLEEVYQDAFCRFFTEKGR
jgi:hypothetical protein